MTLEKIYNNWQSIQPLSEADQKKTQYEVYCWVQLQMRNSRRTIIDV